MTAQLQPENLGNVLADFQRRLQILEAAPRVGISQVRWVKSTGSAFPAVYGTYEYGTVGNTWVDDTAAVGTGYPTLTVRTGSNALVIVGYRPYDVGNAVGFRTNRVQVAVKVDATAGRINREYYQANVDRMYVPVVAADVLSLTPGDHTFTIGAAWVDVNPAGQQPLLSDSYLIVMPLAVA